MLRFTWDAHILDDAWIVFRTARNLLESGTPTYDVTMAPVEGVTSPLWLLFSVAWVWWPGIDPATPARLLGGALMATATGCASWVAGRYAAEAGGSGTLAAVVTGLVLATSGTVAYHGVSALETGLWCFLVVVLGVWMLYPQRVLGVALFALLALCRPEAMVLAPPALAIVALRDRRAALAPALAWVGATGALFATRLAIYGALLPNTYHAKSPSLLEGLEYGMYGALAVGVLPLFAALFAARRAPGLLLIAGIAAAGAIASGGDWMPGWRRLLECWFLVGIAFGIAAGLRWWLAPAALAWLLGSGVAWWGGEDEGAYYHGDLGEVGKMMARTPGVERIAAFDIGRLGWQFPGSVHDIVGLTDARIASAVGGHADKPLDREWFLERDPDLVLLTSFSDPDDPTFTRMELEVYELLAEQGDWYLAWTGPAGASDHLLVFAKQGFELPEHIWVEWD